MFRSNSYDKLPVALNVLKEISSLADNVLLKAKEAKNFDINSAQEFVEAGKLSDEYCKMIYGMYESLRNDYTGNVINRARFVANLKVIQDFLTENPSINNPLLNRSEIMTSQNNFNF